jgi:hypothetical protein
MPTLNSFGRIFLTSVLGYLCKIQTKDQSIDPNQQNQPLLSGEGKAIPKIINDNLKLGKWIFFVKVKFLESRTDSLWQKDCLSAVGAGDSQHSQAGSAGASIDA